MIFAEFFALIAVLAVAGVGGLGIYQLAASAKENRLRIDRQREKKFDDLRSALASGDHHRLDDWLIIYADDVSSDVRKYVKERRDELYLEKNP